MTSHMLRFTIILLLIGLGISGCSPGEPENPILKEATIDGHTVTEIDLNVISDEVTTIGLAEFFEDFEVIRLENSIEALVQNTQMHFADDFFLLGTQHNFPGPARLLRFDYDGNYLNEIGGAGGGPGEHRGNMVETVEYYEEDNTVLVDWGGFENKQLFRPDGTHLEDVRMPMQLMSNITRVSPGEYFSYGSTTSRPRYPRDSVKAVFFNGDGDITKRIARTTYPPENNTGYIPGFGGASLYSWNGETRVYYPDDHTIYRIGDRELVPEVVIRPDEGLASFNEVTSPESMIGQYALEILSETDRNWFIKKSIYTEIDVEEGPSGNWGGMYDFKEQLLVIDKETNRARTYQFTDDLFHMFPEQFFENVFPWHEGFGAHLALPPDFYLRFQEMSETLDQRSPEVVEKLEVLEGLSIDDNYIIFTFSVPEEVVIE